MESVWRRYFRELIRQMEEEMDRIREEVFLRMKEFERKTGCVTPLYNIFESGGELILSVDMPGVSKEDIKIELREDYAIIEAECRRMPRFREAPMRYKLHIPLPYAVVPENAKARYKDGVLEITIPKKIEGKRIPVE